MQRDLITCENIVNDKSDNERYLWIRYLLDSGVASTAFELSR